MYQAVHKVLAEVLAAGEIQRLSKGLDPNSWMNADPLKRLNHVLHHVLKCHHEQNLSTLTEDTCIEQWKHANRGYLHRAVEARSVRVGDYSIS